METKGSKINLESQAEESNVTYYKETITMIGQGDGGSSYYLPVEWRS